MNFKEYCKQNYKEFIFNVIFWTCFLTINNYFIWWKGYFACAKDCYNGKMKVELIEKDNGNIAFKKTRGWIHLEK